MMKEVVISLLFLMTTIISNTYGQKSYLALGDSYTIGESVKQVESFPFQLQAKLKEAGINISAPQIIAKTGWTTGDLTKAIEREKPSNNFDFVTLLIGVNNQYRGYSSENYRKEFREILMMAIKFANSQREHVFVISIPDWGVTNYALLNGFNPDKVASEIDIYNSINKEETLKMGVTYIDITANSRLAKKDASLIALDGLHPSQKMYADWVNSIFPKIKAVIKN